MPEIQIRQPKLLWQLQFEGSWPMAVTFLGSGHKLAAGNQRGELLVWDLPEQPPPFEVQKSYPVRIAPSVAPVRWLQGHTNGISRLVTTPDGRWLISASLDHSLRLWDTQAAAQGEAEIVLDEEYRQEEFRRTKKEEVLQAAGVPIATQSAEYVFEGHRDWVEALAISPDGKRLISGDNSAQLCVWDLETRKPLARWSGQKWNWIVAAALFPDGQQALVSEYRYKRDDFDYPSPALKVWNLTDLSSPSVQLDLLKVQFPKFNPDDHTYGGGSVWRPFVANGLIAAAVSPDGKLLAVGQGGETEKGKVHLLEAETGKLVRDLAEHLNGITDVRFSQDGKQLITTGRDTTVRITQVDDGKEIAQLGTPRGGQFKDWFSSVAVSPDQHFVAATDIAGYVHVWTLDSATPTAK